MTGDGYSIILEGTSANHPGMNAAENVAALASCIRGAISDVDRKYPGSVKSCVATVELSKGERENRANKCPWISCDPWTRPFATYC